MNPITRPTAVGLFALLVLAARPARSAPVPDLDRLTDAIRQSAVDEAVGSTADRRASATRSALSVASRLSAEGSWPDVDYADASRGAWPSVQHCERILQLAAAASVAQAPADRDRLNGAAIRAFDWWRARDPKCLNWWYNEIAIPRFLGKAALVLGDRLSADDRAYVIDKVLPRAQRQKMTGTNTVSLTGNVLLLGLLKRDGPQVAASLDTMFGRATVTDGEGVQADYSFHQHGPQQQFGNYGLELLEMLTRLADTVTPAGWSPGDEQRDTLRHFAFDGVQWTCWRGVMDVNACGRQLFPHSGTEKAERVNRALAQLAAFNPGDRAACDAAQRRNAPDAPNDLVGDRYYWRSDYGVHRRPNWMATVRLCSPRAIGGESLNSENLTGYYLGDGSTFFYRAGGEYQDAVPLMDWRRVPGVTAPWVDAPPPKFSTVKNESRFVGGASDGVDSAIGFDLRRDGVSADKAYFFLGDDVVCMGAAIQSTGADPIVTTIDQFSVTADSPAPAMKSPTEMLARGLRYELLSPGSISTDDRERTGAWSTVFRNGATPRGTVHGRIAALWIDHGKRPTDASYAYRVGPADGGEARAVHVLSNTSALQAVSVGGKVAAVLRTPGSVAVGDRTVAVDQPCSLLIDTAAHSVAVADPTQKLTLLRVTVGGASSEVQLPTGQMAGSTVKLALPR